MRQQTRNEGGRGRSGRDLKSGEMELCGFNGGEGSLILLEGRLDTIKAEPSRTKGSPIFSLPMSHVPGLRDPVLELHGASLQFVDQFAETSSDGKGNIFVMMKYRKISPSYLKNTAPLKECSIAAYVSPRYV